MEVSSHVLMEVDKLNGVMSLKNGVGMFATHPKEPLISGVGLCFRGIPTYECHCKCFAFIVLPI